MFSFSLDATVVAITDKTNKQKYKPGTVFKVSYKPSYDFKIRRTLEVLWKSIFLLVL